MRDVLIDLFDREFIESQEAAGMRVIGQFRDLDDPDRFVWLRGFRDMTARALGLQAFYGGPVWKQHRQAANATMVDSDDVLLLRPVHALSGFSPLAPERPAVGSTVAQRGLVMASINPLDMTSERRLVDYVEHELEPALTDAGAAVFAYFVTEHSANNFPDLPIREGENVFTWFAGFPDVAAHDATNAGRGSFAVSAPDPPGVSGRIQVLRLEPTARSTLAGAIVR
jgi:hypothetical protein